VTALAVLLPVGSVAAEVDTDSLLIKSIGGPAAYERLEQMSGYRQYGRLDLGGIEGEVTLTVLFPDLYHMRVRTPLFELEQGFNGAEAWQRDHTGQVSPLRGTERSQLIAGLYFDSFSYLFPGRIEGSARYLGPTHIRDQIVPTMEFVIEANDTVKIGFDPSTGRRLVDETWADELITWGDYDDYRLIDDIWWPCHTLRETSGGEIRIEAWIDSIEIDPAVDKSIFTMPLENSASVAWTYSDSIVTVDFVYHNGHIYVIGRANAGRSAWFILDSGSSASILNDAYADLLNLTATGSLPAKGVGGYDDVDLTELDSLHLSHLAFGDVTAGMMDLSALAQSLPDEQPFGGVIGYDLLSRFPLQIDYEEQEISFYDPHRFQPATDGTTIPFFLTMQIPTISANLHGHSGDFLIDLGNPFGLILHRGFVVENDLEATLNDVQKETEAIGGIGGITGTKIAVADSLRIESLTVTDVPVVLSQSENGLAGSRQIAGNIGNLLLQRFRVVIDYDTRQLILYSNDR
jgi:hypothetical protein